MKIPVIRQLVTSFSLEELTKAEAALANEELPQITIPGDDEGEQLTHAYAALHIKKSMEDDGLDFKHALRQYTSRVRDSIS